MKRREKIRGYDIVTKQLGLLMGETGEYTLDDIGRMAVISALIRINLPYFLFAGFYRVMPGNLLQIGPYQGNIIACGIIPFGRGVCGVCAEKRESIMVPDVTRFPGYIACDNETRSEIVVPVFRDSRLVAVFDGDSAGYSAFDQTDREYLESIMKAFFDY